MRSCCAGLQLVLAVLGVSATPLAKAAPEPCARARLGELALDLFQPATPAERQGAVKALGECRERAVVGLLEQALLHDEDQNVRVAAAQALARNKAPQADQALRKALELGVPVRVRTQIEQGLADARPVRPSAPVDDFASPFAPRTGQPSPGVAASPAPGEPPVPGDTIHPTPFPVSGDTIHPTPFPVSEHTRPAVAAAPALPFAQQDGLALAVVTSAMSGASLFPYLAALAQQKSPLTLTLTASAGAIIGGGSAWGLSLFGLRPTMPQAVWYTNSTAWGTLAGLALHSGLVAQGGGSEVDKDRALWALLAAGQTAGMAAGIWSARSFEWTPQQMFLADGLMIGSYLTYGGARLLRAETLEVNAPMAVATVPLMVGSAIAARFINPSSSDVHLASAASLAAGWTGFLVGNAVAERATAERQGVGGLLLGTGTGFLASMAGAAFVETDARRVWGSTAFMAAGNLFGLGTHMVVSPLNEAGEVDARNWALGTALGGLAFGLGAYAALPYLELGESTPGMTIAGLGYGSLTWLLATTAADTGVRRPEDGPLVLGGALAAGVAAGTAGLVASRWFDPSPFDHLVVGSGSLMGIGAGLGTARLIAADPSQRGLPDLLGVIGGSAVGFGTMAALQSRSPLDSTDFRAEVSGAAFGALAGSLIPTAGNAEWISSGPRAVRQSRLIGASTMVGAAVGGTAAAAASHLLDARPGQVTLPSAAGVLGTGMGAGLGLAFDTGSSQGARVGMLTGSAVMAAAAIGTDPFLQLSRGLGPSAVEWGLVGTGLGAGYGLVLSQLAEAPSAGSVQGGLLFGASTGLASGLVTSRFVEPTAGGWLTTTGGTLLGGLLGYGTTLLIPPLEDPVADRRMLAAGTLLGGLAGTVGSGFQNALAPLQGTDALATGMGGGFGLLVGMLSPGLNSPQWPSEPGAGRRILGSSWVGLSAGAIGGAITRRYTGATAGEVLVTGLGGFNGMALGLGAGLLLSPADGSSSQAERIGLVAGSVTGLAIGATAWNRLQLKGPQVSLVRTATVVSTWTGLWLPTLGEAHLGDGARDRALGKRMLGGTLAGFGIGTFASTLAAPWVPLDQDTLDDALALYAVGTGAGAGAGALFSTRHDAVTGAMLGVGTAGLIAGGLLHERIDLGRSVPLALALGAEGAWLGGWTATLLSTSADNEPLLDGVSGRALVGGISAGALLGVGTAALLGDAAPLEPRRVGVALTTSSQAMAIVGGLSMLTPALNNRLGVGLMMGATAAGFAGGAVFADQIHFTPRTLPFTLLGGALGIAEGNAFAWASESTDPRTYLGASLIGAGVGSALGLSASAAAGTAAADAPAAMGFAAWGAWIGSFSGALAFRDGAPEVHRVSMGGLLGANAGFGIGFGLMQLGWIEARDIGWLSLFGGAGTLLGAGVTAPFSSGENPTPILAGLAVGPLVGMVAGGFIWPRIRGEGPPVPVASLREDSAGGLPSLPRYFGVKDWQPVFTMLPPPSGVGEGTMLVGAQGTLW